MGAALAVCASTPAPAAVAPEQRASAAATCDTTIANGSTPPGERRSSSHHGNGKLWVGAHRRGEFIVSRDIKEGRAGLQEDGSIRTKYPWWGSSRAGRRLRLTGVALDGEPDRLIASVGQGSSTAGASRFWPTIVRYPRAGCWRVTGRAGTARLRFVVRVRFAGDGAR